MPTFRSISLSMLVIACAASLGGGCFEPDALKQRGGGEAVPGVDGLTIDSVEVNDGAADANGSADGVDADGSQGEVVTDLGTDADANVSDGDSDSPEVSSCEDLRVCQELGKQACEPSTGVLSECVAVDGLPCLIWEAVDCDDGDPCTIAGCDLNGCVAIALTTAACVEVPTCVPGQCEASASVDPLGGCSVTPKVDGTACDDGDVCTAQDSCVAGSCVGGEALDCDDSDACTVDSCDGGCSHTVVSCDDGEVCTVDSCDPASGCLFEPTSGADCDDGDVCTQADACELGTCVGDDPMSCDDGSACTADACDPVSGCVFTAMDMCGDGRCNCGEDHEGCPVDCSPPGTCGDGVCEPGIGENGCNCWGDCDGSTSAVAGGSCNGMCGGQASDGECFCDAQCESYGDCCQDKQAICGCVSP